MSTPHNEITKILIIDQNKSDTDLMEEAIEETMMAHNVHIAHDPTQAIHFLNKNETDLILLDSHITDQSGETFLRTIKTDIRFSHIPVIVLGRSDHSDDIHKFYTLHANCYIVKPANFMKFKKVVGVLIDFWIGIVKLPPVS